MVISPVVLALSAILALLAGSFFGYLWGRSNSKPDYERQLDEVRKQIPEAREREAEARAREKASAETLARTAEELKSALEEKGRLGSEAARVDEAKKLILERDTLIASLNDRITALERSNAEAVRDASAANQRADDLIAKEREAQGAIIAAKDEQIKKLNDFIGQAREVLSIEFKALSSEALKEVSKTLVETADTLIEKHGEKTSADVQLHKEQIHNMLQPVEVTIRRLDKHVEESDNARSKAEALLDDQVKRLAVASESLSNALKKPVVRGSWGEMTLENALENAGLEAEIDFVLQHSTDAEDGRRRTDALVSLPKGRKLVIDSKNLMDSYIALMSCQDEAQRTILADAHSRSLRAHIKALSGKEYWRRYEGLDCVILFIPHDGMYHAAIQDESELIRDACEKRVFVTNPMSLIPLLKAIRFVLDQERLNKSAEEIKRVGEELYSELTRFASNFATVGDKIRNAVDAYNAAIPGLDRFIVSKSRKLKQLGSAKGAEAESPDEIDIAPRLFGSKELREVNGYFSATEQPSQAEEIMVTSE